MCCHGGRDAPDDSGPGGGEKRGERHTGVALCQPVKGQRVDRNAAYINYPVVLRAKGIVNGEDGWLEFDYVPEEHEVRAGHPDYTGRLCVIGAELKEDGLAELFGV